MWRASEKCFFQMALLLPAGSQIVDIRLIEALTYDAKSGISLKKNLQ
jgi:hypothetical protein